MHIFLHRVFPRIFQVIISNGMVSLSKHPMEVVLVLKHAAEKLADANLHKNKRFNTLPLKQFRGIS